MKHDETRLPLPAPSERRAVRLFNRRQFLMGVGVATTWFTVPGAFAEELVLTPAMEAGIADRIWNLRELLSA